MDSEFAEMLKISDMCHFCRCGCCKDGCPMYAEILEETISPKGRNAVIRAVLQGVAEPDERVMRIAYSCLLCRRDEESCTARLKNADATEEFRRYLIDKGQKPLPEHAVLIKSLENYGNPWQEPKSARKRWARGLKDRRLVPGKTHTLFYVGCTFALDRTLQESPRALAKLMDMAGESYGLMLEDELCCGSTVKRIGDKRLFQKLRTENEKRIRESGVKRLVTACSGCYKTLKQDYSKLAEALELLHATEYLVLMVKEGKLRFREHKAKVTYHDPCHLGRHTEVYDAPREVLRAVPSLSLIEMKNSRELARCCGGGAGVKTAYPELSQKAAIRRLREAERTGADTLMTACPFCVQTLSDAARAVGSQLKVAELAVFLAEIAEKGSGPR
jgi:heterodisulfide reductase subunit D